MPLLAENTIFATSSPAVRSSIVLGWAPAARRFASSWLTRLWRELAVLKRTGRHAKTEHSFFICKPGMPKRRLQGGMMRGADTARGRKSGVCTEGSLPRCSHSTRGPPSLEQSFDGLRRQQAFEPRRPTWPSHTQLSRCPLLTELVPHLLQPMASARWGPSAGARVEPGAPTLVPSGSASCAPS